MSNKRKKSEKDSKEKAPAWLSEPGMEIFTAEDMNDPPGWLWDCRECGNAIVEVAPCPECGHHTDHTSDEEGSERLRRSDRIRMKGYTEPAQEAAFKKLLEGMSKAQKAREKKLKGRATGRPTCKVSAETARSMEAKQAAFDKKKQAKSKIEAP